MFIKLSSSKGRDKMTITIMNTASAVDDSVANLPLFDPSKWVHVDTREVRGGGREAIYQYVEGDPRYPMTVRIGFYPKKGELNPAVKDLVVIDENGLARSAVKNSGGNVSIRLETWASDDSGDVTVYEPASMTLAWTCPFTPVADPTGLFKLAGLVFSFAVTNVTAGSLTLESLGRLSFGIPVDLASVVRTDV
jgi:hypothetical protein